MTTLSRLTLLTLTFFVFASPVNADSQSTQRYIEVTGQGIVNETPDIAWVSLTFTQQDEQAQRAKVTVDKQVDDFLNLTTKLGIAKKHIQAARLNIYPEYDHKNNRQLMGYRVSRDVKVKLHNLLNYPKLLEGAVEIGASHTGQLQLDFSNRKMLENQALEAAFKDAHQQAALLAKSSGDAIGETLWIQASGNDRPVPQMRMAVMAESMGDARYPTGEMSLSRQVQARFALTD